MSLSALVQGDLQARNVAFTQPSKLAAMEAHFKSEPGPTRLYLFGFPDEKEQRVLYGVAIPGLLSLLIYHNTTQPVKALDQIPRSDWPPVAITFHSFHLMVGLGMLFIALSGLGCFLLWRRTLFQKRWLMYVFMFAIPLPYAANQLGWVTAEVGRQPWIVYGLLRTSDGVSKAVSGNQILSSIIMFSIIYVLLFAVFLYVLNDKIKHGPDPVHPTQATGTRGLADIAGLRAGTGGGSLTSPEDAQGRREPATPDEPGKT
jgi:cytochrome d ubiquinol oxidase subunit I